jgi:hypothetical protein
MMTISQIKSSNNILNDDGFDTVVSHSTSDDPSEFWKHIRIDDAIYETHVHRIPLYPDALIQLGPEWLIPDKQEERSQMEARKSKIRVHFASPLTSSTDDALPISGNSTTLPNPSTPFVLPTDIPSVTPTVLPTDIPNENTIPAPAPSSCEEPRCSARSTKGKYSEMRYINEVFSTSARDTTISHHTSQLAYQAEIQTDLITGKSHVSDLELTQPNIKSVI